MRRNVSRLLVIAVVLSLMAGCVTKRTFENTTYASLETAVITYDTTMKTLADLYKRGFIGSVEKQKAIELGNKYRAAVRTASLLMAEYIESSERVKAQNYGKVEEALRIAADLGAELMELLGQYQNRMPAELPR